MFCTDWFYIRIPVTVSVGLLSSCQAKLKARQLKRFPFSSSHSSSDSFFTQHLSFSYTRNSFKALECE